MVPRYDTEVLQAATEMGAKAGPAQPLDIHDVTGRRRQAEAAFSLLQLPKLDDVEETIHHVLSKDNFQISIHLFAKRNLDSSTPGPAIVHCHGGGLILGSSDMFSGWLARQVSQTGIPIFSVNYRLAPENSYPIPVEDCYSAVTWLQQHAAEFNVDPNRVAIMGESAGGGLAAGVALLARQRNLTPPLAKQFLLCPMLDDRNTIPDPTIEPLLAFWNTTDNITGWTAYLGDKIGADDVVPYAAPARASVERLPPTYIDVGTLDLFRDEAIKYAARLAEANIDVELHVFPGVPHAFEHIAPEAAITKVANTARVHALSSF